MLPTWIYYFTRLSFTLLSSLYPAHSSNLFTTTNTYDAFSAMDVEQAAYSDLSAIEEEIFRGVLDAIFGVQNRDAPEEEPEEWHQDMALMEKVAIAFGNAASSGDKSLFGITFSDFSSERVPLSTTRDSLIRVFEILDIPELRAEFEPFLDAPLDTEEQQAAARATLCRITGFPATVKERPTAKELRVLRLAIVQDALVRWKDQKKILRPFLKDILRFQCQDDQVAAIDKIIAMVASETEVVERLNKMRDIIIHEHDEL